MMTGKTHTPNRCSKIPLLLGVALALPLLLAGCNTVSGLGEDVEAAGEASEKSAEKNKKY